MLGRNDYTRRELEDGRATIARELAAWRKTAGAAAKAGPDGRAALVDFEPVFFNGLVLVLDRLYVHRIRSVTGNDGNPLNEVELIAESLINNGGLMVDSTVIKYMPQSSVTRLRVGERIELTEARFEALSSAFFADLERRFVTA